jgi:hypothetical protein
MKVLFILKHRDTYWGDRPSSATPTTLSSGLANSAQFVCDALNLSEKVTAKLVQVVDNNCIDREVHLFRPDIVIIEAYWVVPEKFAVLTPLHPKVKWIIRNHSEIPFMAQEGIAVDWSIKYLQYPNVYVSGNSSRSYRDMINFLTPIYGSIIKERILFLPNIYPSVHRRNCIPKQRTPVLDVSCFGAIRPLKNHLLQAMTAISYAHDRHCDLRFHINGSRIEGGSASNSILKNLQLLFQHMPNCELVEHPWYPHEEFLGIMEQMDVSMQVSFSETFNIISADAATVGVPVITSSEVLWAPWFTRADPTSGRSIRKRLEFMLKYGPLPAVEWLVQNSLNNYSRESLERWLGNLKKL